MDSIIDSASKLRELKNYLMMLKESGIDRIPVSAQLGNFKVIIPAVPSTNPAPAAAPSMAKTKPVRNPNTGNDELVSVMEELGDCTRCPLCETRKTIVFGSGNPSADLMFIGEGPGADEDEQGLPFVGRAGKKLTEIIEKGMNLDREQDTYICNIVKCRPPGNRDPKPEEVAACKPFLLKQIEAVKPKVLVALGKPASSTLLERNVAITKERGNWFEFHGIPLMLTLHPAYLLRAYTVENRKAVHQDMLQVLEKLKS